MFSGRYLNARPPRFQVGNEISIESNEALTPSIDKGDSDRPCFAFERRSTDYPMYGVNVISGLESTDEDVEVVDSSVATRVTSIAVTQQGATNYGLVAYEDTVATEYLIKAFSSADIELTVGSSYQLNATQDGHCKVVTLSDLKGLALYENASANGTVYARAMTMDISRVITLGAQVTASSNLNSVGPPNANTWDFCQIDTDKALIVARHDTNDQLLGLVLTVSGTTTTVNSEAVLVSGLTTVAASSIVRVIKTGTDQALVTWFDEGDGTLYGGTINVSGTTPSLASYRWIGSPATDCTYSLAVSTNSRYAAVLSNKVGSGAGDERYHIQPLLLNSQGIITSVSGPSEIHDDEERLYTNQLCALTENKFVAILRDSSPDRIFLKVLQIGN